MPKSGSRTALDSTVAIAILNNREEFVSWAQEFDEVYLPVPTVGELRFGVLNSGQSVANQQNLNDLISRCRVLDVRLETTNAYARLRLHLRKKGRPIPENDIWIAAICVEHGLSLATTDGHFAEFGEVVEFEPLPV